MQIVQAPQEVLAKKAEQIKKIDKHILEFIGKMKETLLAAKDPEGVGLAAPQVGKSLQIFIVKPTAKDPITVYINPHLTIPNSEKKELLKKSANKTGTEEDVQLEGCLSLKDIWGTVARAPEVMIEYLDEEGKKQKEEAHGFLATILQHEYDHLQGILFPRRVLEQKSKLYKSRKDEKGEDIFEEIKL